MLKKLKLQPNPFMRKLVTLVSFVSLIVLIHACSKDSSTTQTAATVNTAQIKLQLGKAIFQDKNLSQPAGQSCSSCHSAETGFSDLNHNIVSPGAVDGLFGNRNAPSIAYSMYAPSLHYSANDTAYVGGMFWDGRVNTLQTQAQKPFLNPVEMGNANAQAVVTKVQNASYYNLYTQVYGQIADATTAFNNIADAIATYEADPSFANRFTSKYDFYLQHQATLTAEEDSGLVLFNGKANCASCHLTTPDSASGKILFQDFTYESDGVPANPNNPFYNMLPIYNPQGKNFVDLGLGGPGGGVPNNAAYYGMFKTPTLRNIALTSPYFHNGVFSKLEDVVHFYNVGHTIAQPYGPAEVAVNIDSAACGNLGLTATQEGYIVSFLKTLTDGYNQ